jgi:hypothetical protein
MKINRSKIIKIILMAQMLAGLVLAGAPALSVPEAPTVAAATDETWIIPETVSAGGGHTCGIKSDGTLACWGYNDYGQSSPPAGTFTQVSAGELHTCGVKSDGTVTCWGDDSYEQSKIPTGTFVQVSAGAYHTCGV